jgi:hypothetical protein
VATAADCANLGGTVVLSCELCVPSGNDCWNTQCGESRYDFCETPIPADFFAPGSQPFEGTVYWRSDTVLPAATIMRRSEEAVIGLGQCQTVPIELIQLSLVSCQPIIVNGPIPTQWDVRVQNSGAPQGSTTVCKTHPNGGTFDSTFFVQPVFIFTQVGNPGNVRVFDTGSEGIPPTQFDSPAPSNWSTLPLNPPCNPNFDFCCTQGFTPGYDSTPGPGCTTDIQCCTPVGHEGPGHIHETGPPVCTPCECGACCLPNHACAEVVQSPPNTAAAVCASMGGTYMGAGTSCADTDGDGLADVLESNGCCGPKDNCHTGTDPSLADTDGDGVSDGAELAGGDDPCLAAGVPDPPTANPFGTCTNNNANCTVGGPPCGAGGICDPCNQVRSMSFQIPASSAGSDTAIRVKLTSLYDVTPPPPNSGVDPGPALAPFEGQYRYLNTIPGTLSRCCNPSSNPTACHPAATCSSDLDCMGLGLNTKCMKNLCPDSPAFSTYFRCARLGCTPQYRDWGSDFSDLITYASGDSVVSDSTYHVAILAASCAGNEAACAAASTELPVLTERWGNVDCSQAEVPTAQDIGFVVSKVKDAAGAFIKPRTQLREAVPNPLGLVAAPDIGRIVDAVKGRHYPDTWIPAACP